MTGSAPGGRHRFPDGDPPTDPFAAPGPEPGHAGRRTAMGTSGQPYRPKVPFGHGGGLGHAHAHGHGHGGDGRASARRVRIVLAALLVPCALAVLVGVVALAPTPGEYRQVIDDARGAAGTNGAAAAAAQESVGATVRAASTETDCADPGAPAAPGSGCVTLTVRLDGGPAPGREITTPVPAGAGAPRFAVGDAVVLAFSGADPADPSSYQVTDYQRGLPMAVLAAVFAVAVVVLGRRQGLAALAALGVTLAVLGLFVLPALLTGAPPVAVALTAAGLVVGVVLPLTHGPSARTATAALGTLASLALIGVLAVVFGVLTRLTGLGEQASQLAGIVGIDARGLLLAGVIIGALGVLDDITVTQTSTVWELHRVDPTRGLGDLYGSAMRVGRDHVASAVNTLVLAYAGAALPLLLLFALGGRGLGDLLGAEDVAQEVLRTLVGSIGIVAAVPVTTLLAAVVVRSVGVRSVGVRSVGVRSVGVRSVGVRSVGVRSVRARA